MRKALQTLLERLTGRRRPPAAVIAAPAYDPEWTDGERRQMAHLLSSDFGKRLWNRFRAVEFHAYQTAGTDCMHTGYSAARARGFSDAREWLESLSRSACVTAEEVATPDQSQMYAQQPEGEAELRERLSP